MDSLNFAYLADEFPELARFGEEAEGLVYVHPKSALVVLRSYAESLVGLLIRGLGLPIEEATLNDRVNHVSFKSNIDWRIIKKINYLRRQGNKAAHANEQKIELGSQDALAALEEAFRLGMWFCGAYGRQGIDLDIEFQAPTEPVHLELKIQTLKSDLEEKEQRLQLALAELAKVKEAEANTQLAIEMLQAQYDESRLQSFRQRSEEVTQCFDLRDDVTTRRCNMKEAFENYQLTDDQEQLVSRLDAFFKDPAQRVFLLKGYAGTGKTFITRGLTEFFREVGRNYVLAAPTGKAAKVIAHKTGSEAFTIHKTIYSFKDLKQFKVDGLDGSETYKFYSELASNENSADTVYIIDEASMVSNVYSEGEFFRSGSGYLLQDLFSYINLDHNDHDKKVILIGDSVQLPPVGMSASPALDPQYLREHCNVDSVSYELKEVVRQAADSGVMKNAMQLREAVESKTFNKLDFDLQAGDVQHIEHPELLDRYLEASDHRVSDKAIIVAYSNDSVAEYNRQIRERLFPGVPSVTAGDKLMLVVNNNLHDIFLSNGDFGFVFEVANEPEIRSIRLRSKNQETGQTEERFVELHFRKALMGFRDLQGRAHRFWCELLENLLYSEQAALSSDENKALYVDFCIRHSSLRPGTKEFRDTLRTDPYFNALRVKFGYAITCHKAQGSEWSTVFVNCSTHQSKLSAGYFRWLYTAITRTADKLYVLNEPHLGVGTNIKVAAMPPWASVSAAPEQPVSETMGRPRDKSQPLGQGDELYGISPQNTFSLAILDRVKQAIAGLEVKIDSVHQNQYQEAYLLMSSAGPIRINIGYKANGKVSSVMAQPSTDLAQQIVTALEPLKGRIIIQQSSADNATQLQFSEPFLREFYERILEKCRAEGVGIAGVVSHEWTEVYSFTRDSEFATFKFYYNGKQRFTKAIPEPNSCSSLEFSQQVANLVGAL